MSEETTDGGSSRLLPAGAIGAVILLGIAATVYASITRNGDETGSSSGTNYRKKYGLMALITLLENDASRKVVLTLLKAIARRA